MYSIREFYRLSEGYGLDNKSSPMTCRSSCA
jgi:hypothetical protein